MHSIKHRMVISFMFIIIITVIILEFFLIHGIRQSYYGSLRDSLFSQLQTATDLYVRYFADATLAENVLNNVDTFWKQIPAQVEIIDMQGQVLMNSRGTITDLTPEMEDVTAALAGRTASWVGQVPYDNEKIMAASAPIMVDNEQIGVLRLLASLREVNHEIRVNAYRYLSFGGLVVIISGLVSLILANTLTEPLKQVTKAAEAMAAGNFQVKSAYRSRDEIGKLSETLNYLAGEIVKKEELKNDFISSVSHELRTPLTSIKGWAITLKEDYENKTFLQGGLNIIEKECDRLTEMVTELLDFSRFVSGKITLKKEKVEITALLAQLKMQLAPRAAREKIEFQVLLPETPL
ncbi:MAG: HAMP domain-containing histidine kinase, partial [Firmicutes bacterium]|nr:HAMP domain-containing histidine kinase [Bacillota bacterium]